MATVTAFIRMSTQGIPPLALTGATFGALLAGLFYKYGRKFYFSALGEILGTGIIGSIVSYPVMVLFTGSAAKLSWFIYTPRFFGATLIGTAIAFLAFRFLIKQEFFKKVHDFYTTRWKAGTYEADYNQAALFGEHRMGVGDFVIRTDRKSVV